MPNAPEALPDLTREYSLTEEQIARYREDGHLLLRNVASAAEVAAYRPVIANAVRRHSTETRPLEDRDTYGKAFLQVWQLKDRDPDVRRFVLARRFAKIAADLLGVAGVRIFNDQALFKEPGGGPTPWHQDQQYWPLDTDKSITMWMPLVDVPAEVGSMTFVSGSHRPAYQQLARMNISDESDEYFRRYVVERGLRVASYGAVSAGDATFHAGWTMHRAPGNPTDRMREVMTIIYYADGAKVIAADSPHAQAAFEVEFAGLKPGDLAAAPQNPLVYRRGE